MNDNLQDVEEINNVIGLSVQELISVRKKMQTLGLELSDLIEFLDRDKVQLFSEMKIEICHLNTKLSRIKDFLD